MTCDPHWLAGSDVFLARGAGGGFRATWRLWPVWLAGSDVFLDGGVQSYLMALTCDPHSLCDWQAVMCFWTGGFRATWWRWPVTPILCVTGRQWCVSGRGGSELPDGADLWPPFSVWLAGSDVFLDGGVQSYLMALTCDPHSLCDWQAVMCFWTGGFRATWQLWPVTPILCVTARQWCVSGRGGSELPDGADLWPPFSVWLAGSDVFLAGGGVQSYLTLTCDPHSLCDWQAVMCFWTGGFRATWRRWPVTPILCVTGRQWCVSGRGGCSELPDGADLWPPFSVWLAGSDVFLDGGVQSYLTALTCDPHSLCDWQAVMCFWTGGFRATWRLWPVTPILCVTGRQWCVSGRGGSELPDGADLWPPFSVWLAGSDVFLDGGVQSYLTALTCDPHSLCDWQAVMCFWTGGFRATWRRWPVTPILCVTGRQWCVSGRGGSELPDGSDLWPPFSVWLAGSDVFLDGGGWELPDGADLWPPFSVWLAGSDVFLAGGVQSYLTALTCDPHSLCDWQAVMCFWTGGFRATWWRWPVTPILCVTGRQWCVSGRGGSELPDGADLWPPFSVWLAGSDVFLDGGVQSYLTALTCDPHSLCDWQAVMCFWTGGFRATWWRWPVTPILCVTGRQWCVSGRGGSELPDSSDLWPPFSVWLPGSDVFLDGGVQSYLMALTCDPHSLCDWQAVMCFWTGGFRATWRRWPVTPILCVTGRQWCVSGRGGSELPDGSDLWPPFSVWLAGSDVFLDGGVQSYLTALLRLYCSRTCFLDKIDLKEAIVGVASFYDL